MSHYNVIREISVEVDESKFTEEFMQNFRDHFFLFYDVEEHKEHIAQLYGRGVIELNPAFIEGYGAPNSLGIEIKDNGFYVEES